MTRLTVPVGPLSPGRAARAPQQAVPTGGAALADFGQVMAQVGKGLEAERLDRELKRSQVDLTRDVNDLRLSVQQIGDPDAADAAWSQGVQALREQYDTATAETGRPLIDPKNREPFGLAFDQLTNAVAFDLGRRTVGLRNAEREASFLRYAHEATRTGASADAGTVDVLLSQGNEQIEGLLAAGVIDAAEAERRRIGLQGDISNARAIRMVSDDPEAFIAAADAGGFLGLEADTVARYRVQAQGKLEADARAAATAAEKAALERKKAINDRIREIRDIAADGREAVDERFLEDPEVQQSEYYGEAKAAIALREENGSLATLTPAQLAALIDEEEARKVTKPYQTERLKVLQERLEEHEKGYDEDPIAYAGTVGVAEISPIDFSADSETLAAELTRRAQIGEELVSAGFARDSRILTEAEADALETALDAENDPEERMRLAGVVSRTVGTAELQRLSGDPVLVHAGDFLSAGNPPGRALDMLRGQAALARENVVMPPLADRRGVSFQVLDAVYADLPGGDALQERTLAAADALYARRMGRVDPTADIDDDRYTQALHEVLGGTGRHGTAQARGGIQEVAGVPVILPKGAGAPEVEQALSRLGYAQDPGNPRSFRWSAEGLEARLKAVSGGQLPRIDGELPDQRTMSELQLMAAGDDSYVFVRPSADPAEPPTVLMNDQGAPFTFSLRRLLREAAK
ncbi:hypothetical protein [Salipiger marinus]|uniref:Uncharacterized protein n=1 Tax=Salipiger marinus TaxID=555512 RepID=A0A1G8LKR4_9RHOB|nr:hypothetical protein [Salipiger marinus]SDI56258.1 hypothetical protein SAMN04487993_1006222 [Salipiger marinus]